MTRAIQQSVILRASPEKLFDAFLDSKKHALLTGAPAKISRKAGGRFRAFGGQIYGRNLLVVPKRMIVQAWRANHWKAADPDSILILQFIKVPGGGRIELTHANVPAHDHKGVTQGWAKYYWKPWKAYLAKR
jgi:activator of HSP90 ATPase